MVKLQQACTHLIVINVQIKNIWWTNLEEKKTTLQMASEIMVTIL